LKVNEVETIETQT